MEFLKKYFNDVVILTTIIIGLVGGTWILNTAENPVSVAIFYALAITSFTYRFLGGIDKDTGFTIGAMKATGTLAAMFGSIWLIFKLSQGAQVPSVDIPQNFRPNEIFMFKDTGEPVEFTIPTYFKGVKDTLIFGLLPKEKYKEIPRKLIFEEEKAYISAKTDSTYLGYIDIDREEFAYSTLTNKQSLALGLYYSQTDSATGERKDSHRAVDYLFKVVRESKDQTLIERALNQLYFLQPFYSDAVQFDQFIESTKKLKTGYNLYLELAATHLNYSRKFADNKIEQKGAALTYYLKFLSTKQSQSKNLSKRKKGVIEIVEELLKVELNNDEYIMQNNRKDQILEAMRKHDRAQLKQLGDELAMHFLNDMSV